MTRLSTRQSKNPVAANLRRAQAEAGLTTAELARTIDVNIRLLQKWRAGTVEPRWGNLAKLAVALGVSVADLYADPAEKAEAA
jgi:transcriptional regulator with XRE-family HTH domain